MEAALNIGYSLLDKGLIPDFVLRPVIRLLCRQRLREIEHGSLAASHEAKMKWIEEVRTRSTIAEKTEKANEQHYEVPTDFILSCLAPYAKYSSCLYLTGKESLDEAEVLMLESYCEKAKLKDGQDILDLGCGWGSLSIFLAERITGLSNSQTQREYILSTAKSRGLKNVHIITADVNKHEFQESQKFDRILSIEMFEHMKNYEVLLRKVASWLRPSGKVGEDDSFLFVHIFCHRTTPYHFEESDGWMAQMFFSGGTMPSFDMLSFFQSDVTLVRSWFVNGGNYSRTLEDWLKRQDKNRRRGLEVLENDAMSKGLSKENGRKTFNRFRVFYMACSELFGMNGGEEWGVGHYLFKRK